MSQHDQQQLSRIAEMLDLIIEKHPHSTDIVNAFRPVIMEKRRLLKTLDCTPMDLSNIDPSLIRQGIPVIRQATLFQLGDPLEHPSLSLVSALKQGFPNIQVDMDRLIGHIYDKTLDLFGLLRAYFDNDDKMIEEWSTSLQIQPASLHLLLRAVSWVILHKRRRQIADFVDEFGWEKGYCPICGSFPVLSTIQEKGGVRRLHCDQCGHGWRFSRVICPYCEYESMKEMTYFYVEDDPREAAYTCDQCKRYLVTLHQVSDLGVEDFDIAPLGLIHLDLIMQVRGLLPMATSEWNIF